MSSNSRLPEGNYSLDNLFKRAAVSRSKFGAYIGAMLHAYDEMRASRRDANIPVFAFCGMGRAGKDTSAEYWCKKTNTVYSGSSSGIVLPIIADSIGVSEEQAWEERHQHRRFWIEWCHAFRHDDPTMLIKMALGKGDVAVGIRGDIELRTAVSAGIIDYVFWVENPRVPKDETVEFRPEDCDFTILNSGSLEQLYRRWDKMIELVTRQHFYFRDNPKRT